MKILVSGFEAFGESKINPSERLVRGLERQPAAGVEICGVVLPVDRARGPRALLDAVEQERPEAVLCLGQAGRRARVSIERVAVNLLDFSIPDNAGVLVLDEPVVPGGPDAYFATLPVRRLYQAVMQAGIPVELSLSAGAYLCNQVLYALLHHLHEREWKIPAGFVHLPFLPEHAAVLPGPAAPSMSLETMQTALNVMLKELAKEPAGAEHGW